MNLTKNQIYIISALVIIVVAYFLFFRKKTNAEAAAKMATPPPPATGSEPGAESGWSGAWNYTPEMTMNALNGSYNPYESGFGGGLGIPGIKTSPVPPASNVKSLGTDWLQGANKL